MKPKCTLYITFVNDLKEDLSVVAGSADLTYNCFCLYILKLKGVTFVIIIMLLGFLFFCFFFSLLLIKKPVAMFDLWLLLKLTESNFEN